jgi:hypothetical protein
LREVTSATKAKRRGALSVGKTTLARLEKIGFDQSSIDPALDVRIIRSALDLTDPENRSIAKLRSDSAKRAL